LFFSDRCITIILPYPSKPTLIKNKTASHIKIIDNTTENIDRLKINFSSEDIREFLFSTKFLFQSIDRVQIFDSEFNLLGDTDTLDLDPNAFSRSLNIIEMSDLNNQSIQNKNLEESNKSFESKEIFEDLKKYSYSADYGKPLTYSKENYDQFLLVTVKNVVSENKTIGYLAITENANEIKAAIDERRNFIIRTALLVALVILIFSYVLNRYFLKPIKNLVQYTNIIKNKSKEKTNIGNIKKRNDELGKLSNSLDEMTNELNKRITTAENYSTDLLHEIRNPLASLKSASEIISETK
jgi:Signal transduction histidine kinase